MQGKAALARVQLNKSLTAQAADGISAGGARQQLLHRAKAIGAQVAGASGVR